MEFRKFCNNIKLRASWITDEIKRRETIIKTEKDAKDALLRLEFDKELKKQDKNSKYNFEDIVAINIFNAWYPGEELGTEYEIIKKAIKSII